MNAFSQLMMTFLACFFVSLPTFARRESIQSVVGNGSVFDVTCVNGNKEQVDAQGLKDNDVCPKRASLPYPGACVVDDNSFSTQDGGCKDLSSGLVWSSFASNPVSNNFYSYYSTQGKKLDRGNDAIDYCRNLREGAHSDWRIPSPTELMTISGRGGAAETHFNYSNRIVDWMLTNVVTQTGYNVTATLVYISTAKIHVESRNQLAGYVATVYGNLICVRN